MLPPLAIARHDRAGISQGRRLTNNNCDNYQYSILTSHYSSNPSLHMDGKR